ncbi:MAG: bifunctional phosphoglucose/phosphomannose isomerase [archaeon]
MNMSDLLKCLPQHCNEAKELGKKIRLQARQVFVTGMGGSAASGDLLKAYVSDEINVQVNRDYGIRVDNTSLLFALSYSGNTEETISAFRMAVKCGAKVVGISSGGMLKLLCSQFSCPHILIPGGLPPRLATPYLFFPMLNVLHNAGLIGDKSDETRSAIEALKKDVYEAMGRELAGKLRDRIPVIYASNRYAPVAMKFKTDINENAKAPAFYNLIPEMNHNEITGYVNRVGNYHVIIIRDEDDEVSIKRRIDITKRIMKKQGLDVTEIHVKGTSYLTKLFSSLYIGEWTSYHLAKAYSTDPMPVEIIERFKKELKKI